MELPAAWLPIVRALHVAGVVLWVGGVAFVTTVLIPGVRAEYPPAERLAAFLRLEDRFSRQARLSVALVGATGFWMLQAYHLWPRFASLRFWWMHAMVGVWLVFAAMLYVIEPLFMHRRLAKSPDPARAFARMEAMHRVLLAISLVTVLGAVAGVHGFG